MSEMHPLGDEFDRIARALRGLPGPEAVPGAAPPDQLGRVKRGEEKTMTRTTATEDQMTQIYVYRGEVQS